MKNQLKIWIAPEIVHLFNVSDLKVEVISNKTREVIQRYYAEAGVNDILIVPVFQNYLQVVTKIRQRGIQGLIIFIIDNKLNAQHYQDMLVNCILFLDNESLKNQEILIIIRYLIIKEIERMHMYNEIISLSKSKKEDDAAFEPEEAVEATDKPANDSKIMKEDFKDAEDIYYLFKEIQDDQRRFIFSFKYLMKDENKYIPINLTALIGRVLNQNIMLVSIKPIVNLASMLTKGDEVKLSFKYGDKTYTCETKLKRINDTQSVEIDFPTEVILQKRKYVRIIPSIEDHMGVQIRNEITPTFTVDLIDISERGIAFYHSDIFDEKNPLMIHIQLSNDHLICKGIIRQKNEAAGHFRYGVELYPNESDVEKIVKYVLQKQIDIIEKIKKEN